MTYEKLKQAATKGTVQQFQEAFKLYKTPLNKDQRIEIFLELVNKFNFTNGSNALDKIEFMFSQFPDPTEQDEMLHAKNHYAFSNSLIYGNQETCKKLAYLVKDPEKRRDMIKKTISPLFFIQQMALEGSSVLKNCIYMHLLFYPENKESYLKDSLNSDAKNCTFLMMNFQYLAKISDTTILKFYINQLTDKNLVKSTITAIRPRLNIFITPLEIAYRENNINNFCYILAFYPETEQEELIKKFFWPHQRYYVRELTQIYTDIIYLQSLVPYDYNKAVIQYTELRKTCKSPLIEELNKDILSIILAELSGLRKEQAISVFDAMTPSKTYLYDGSDKLLSSCYSELFFLFTLLKDQDISNITKKYTKKHRKTNNHTNYNLLSYKNLPYVASGFVAILTSCYAPATASAFALGGLFYYCYKGSTTLDSSRDHYQITNMAIIAKDFINDTYSRVSNSWVAKLAAERTKQVEQFLGQS